MQQRAVLPGKINIFFPFFYEMYFILRKNDTAKLITKAQLDSSFFPFLFIFSCRLSLFFRVSSFHGFGCIQCIPPSCQFMLWLLIHIHIGRQSEFCLLAAGYIMKSISYYKHAEQQQLKKMFQLRSFMCVNSKYTHTHTRTHKENALGKNQIDIQPVK